MWPGQVTGQPSSHVGSQCFTAPWNRCDAWEACLPPAISLLGSGYDGPSDTWSQASCPPKTSLDSFLGCMQGWTEQSLLMTAVGTRGTRFYAASGWAHGLLCEFRHTAHFVAFSCTPSPDVMLSRWAGCPRIFPRDSLFHLACLRIPKVAPPVSTGLLGVRVRNQPQFCTFSTAVTSAASIQRCCWSLTTNNATNSCLQIEWCSWWFRSPLKTQQYHHPTGTQLLCLVSRAYPWGQDNISLDTLLCSDPYCRGLQPRTNPRELTYPQKCTLELPHSWELEVLSETFCHHAVKAAHSS